MTRKSAKILAEFGPYPGADHVHGVTFDGAQVWFAAGDTLKAIDPQSGAHLRDLAVDGHAGSAFDGQYIYQIADERIDKLDPQTGEIVASIPVPKGRGCSGMAWAEGFLWVGQYQDRRIQQVDPNTGAVIRSIPSDRHVTGVTWLDGDLWHATWEANASEIRRVDAKSGTVIDTLHLPEGVIISGLESDGVDRFFCGGGTSGKLRIVAAP